VEFGGKKFLQGRRDTVSSVELKAGEHADIKLGTKKEGDYNRRGIGGMQILVLRGERRRHGDQVSRAWPVTGKKRKQRVSKRRF